MVNRRPRRRGGNRNDVQDERVSGVPAKADSSVPDDSRVRVEILDGRPFLLHNAHVSSGKEPPKRCPVCLGKLAEMVVVVEVPLPSGKVDKGGGADEADAASFARNLELWPWEQPDGQVRT